MPSSLLRVALETLQDPSTAPGLRAVALSTILAALDNAIEVPPGAHVASWRYLLGSDHGAAAMHRHELVHPEVARDAVRVLLDAEAGETAQDLAMATLKGANISVVADDDIVTIADRVLTEGRSRRVTWLIEQTHEYRGLAPAFLVLIRDRLAGADEPTVRAASIDIGALLPRLDVEFAAKMFGDPSSLVRSAVADSLDNVEQLDRDRALRLIRNRLDHESNRIVLSACYASLSSLIRRRPRQGEEN